MPFQAVFSTLSAFVDEHRIVLSVFMGLGALLFLAEDTIQAPKTRSCSTLRILRVSGLCTVLFLAVNLLFRLPLEYNPVDLSGKSYLVTGCTPGGIGYESARALLEWNASSVVCSMRSAEKAAALKASMVGAGPGKFDVVVMELTSFDSVRAAAKELVTRFPKLDGVIFNAGLMNSQRLITRDGFEEMYQVNHLSQFLLARLLEDHLKTSARLVFISSGAHFHFGKLDREVYGTKPGGRIVFNDVVSQWMTYADTKLMNILTAKAFAKRLATKQITVNSACPGLVQTSFQSRMPDSLTTQLVHFLVNFVSRNARMGAARGLHAITSPDHVRTTGYYFDSYVSMPANSDITEDNAEWLFQTSNRLVGLSV